MFTWAYLEISLSNELVVLSIQYWYLNQLGNLHLQAIPKF